MSVEMHISNQINKQNVVLVFYTVLFNNLTRCQVMVSIAVS